MMSTTFTSKRMRSHARLCLRVGTIPYVPVNGRPVPDQKYSRPTEPQSSGSYEAYDHLKKCSCFWMINSEKNCWFKFSYPFLCQVKPCTEVIEKKNKITS